MTKKSEVAVIDFTKFNVAQLPELNGKKEEIKAVIEANPVIEVTDNASYELAKKSRTAVRTLRTSIQGEKTEVVGRIKKNVLDIVANEYDSLITGVKNDENARQEHVTAWEEKKEAERLEKVRLEQERIDGIKKSIGEFRQFWEDKISALTFETIEDVSDLYSVAVVEFDRDSLAEFDVLFTDSVNYIDKLLEIRINTVTEQEQIRIDQENIKIQNEIADWFRIWSSRIIKAETSEYCQELFKGFNDEKPISCGNFQAEFAEKRSSLVESFETRIEMLKSHEIQQENQRIYQEKFLAEKKEFEAKQSEAKFQERKKFLVDEDYWRIYLLAECGEEEDVAKEKLINFDDSEFEDFKLAVIKSKELVVAIDNYKSDEIAKEDYHEEDVDQKAIGLSTRHKANTPAIEYVDPRNVSYQNTTTDVNKIQEFESFTETQEVEFEETWESIHDDFVDFTEIDDSINFYYWLRDNFNTPTRKI